MPVGLTQSFVDERARLVERFRGQGLTEQDTKNAFIEPILGALGWPKEDLDRVRAEYRHTSRDNPVDYALFDEGRPVMFVEAKALDHDIDSHKFVSQVLSYANVAGVDWALITNGHQWDLYSVFARTDAAKKRFFSTHLRDADFRRWMDWVTPARLVGNELEQLWQLLVVERQVRETVTRLFSERDHALVSFLAEQTRLSVADVAQALQTLQPTFAGAGLDERIAVLAAKGRTMAPRPEGERRRVEATPAAVPPAPVAEATTTPSIATSGQPSGPPARAQESALGRSVAPPEVQPDRPSATEGVERVAVPDRLVAPIPGSKLRRWTIGERVWTLTMWKDLLLETLKHLHVSKPDRYQAIFDAPEFKGRRRRYLARSPEGIRAPVVIPGGYVETNLSAGSTVSLVSELLSFCGVDLRTTRYEADPPEASG